MDSNDNNDLNIRDPDPVIRERLVGYNNDDDDFANYNYSYLESNSNDDITQILKQSLEEFETAEEQKIQEMLAIERSKIAEKYTSIKQKLQKVQSYDTTNKSTYDTIIAIIELYELEYLETYTLDETSYNNIFKFLKTIRLTSEELSLLGSLIIV
jgi:Rad3-related DNA helicase